MNTIFFQPNIYTLHKPLLHQELPLDTLTEILSYLPQNELINSSLVNKNWFKLSISNGFWKPFYLNKFNDSENQHLLISNWKNAYIQKQKNRTYQVPRAFIEEIDALLPDDMMLTGLQHTVHNHNRQKYLAMVVFCALSSIYPIATVGVVTTASAFCHVRNNLNSTSGNIITQRDSIPCGSYEVVVVGTLSSLLAVQFLIISFVGALICCFSKKTRVKSTDLSLKQICQYTPLHIKDKCQSLACNIL